jgi:hypothetical protein
VAINRSAAAVKRYAKRSPHVNATENSYRMLVPVLEKGFTKEDEDNEVSESMEATKGTAAPAADSAEKSE